jgi:hypothetical protein
MYTIIIDMFDDVTEAWQRYDSITSTDDNTNYKENALLYFRFSSVCHFDYIILIK